jgi:ankyrin repeat protein
MKNILFTLSVFLVSFSCLAGNVDIFTAMKNNDYDAIEAISSKITTKEVETLLKQEAIINKKPNFKGELLMNISKYSDTPDIIGLLVKSGVNVEYKDDYLKNTALNKAASVNENTNILKKLIELGANINSIDKYGNTVLINASRFNKNLDVIKMLVEAGANINATGYDKRTALLGALERNPNLDIARYLIEAGADVKARDNYGYTALHYLVKSEVDAPDIVQTLIDKGVDIEAKTSGCNRAIDYAKACNLSKTSELLLKAGSEPSRVVVDCKEFKTYWHGNPTCPYKPTQKTKKSKWYEIFK